MSNDALRLADELAEEAERRVCHVAMAPASLLKDAALVRQQAERIAELEARVHTCGPTCSKAGCINRRITAERDQLRAEVERLKPNAERWEYAMNSEEFAMCEWDTVFGEPCWVPISEESAIDLARTTHKDQA